MIEAQQQRPAGVGAVLSLALTYEGLSSFIADLISQGRKPMSVIVSEYDRRELNQQIMDTAIEPVAKHDQRPDGDRVSLGFVQGVMISASPLVARGQARLIYPKPTLEAIADQHRGRTY